MSKESVTVGCKLPHGIILDVKTASGELVRQIIKGSNDARIVGGYGITENVSSELWDQWLKEHPRHKAVLNGSLFIHNELKSAISIAKERRKVETGLDPVDPLRSGMLVGADGKVDPVAERNYRKQCAENPDRNKQQRE
jgi:hypothetical protein